MTTQADQPSEVVAADPATTSVDDDATLSTDSPKRLVGPIGWPILVVVLTFGYALVPMLVGSRHFYRRGDSASQFIPTWYHLGDLLRSGQWPPTLDPASWQGGNYPAEALFGIYNPVNALNWVFVTLLPDMNVAATLVKAEFLAILALGVYLLCREYGARSWASSLVAVAMPFAGYTLYWDAASWASGLSAFMYLPHVWWSFRRSSRGRLNPIWAFLIGSLAITQGNPYGTLGVVVVGAALVVEFLAERHWAALRRLIITGLCTAAWLPLVYAPILATAPLARRGNIARFTNDNMMSPNLGDLLNLSAPTYLPDISTFVDPMSVPAVYFAWFVIPLLPWLRWSALRGRWSSLVGVLTFAGLYALMTLGPSTLWLFRWPLRLVEYLQVSLAVLFALLLSAGLERTRIRQRSLASLALIALGGFLSLAETPHQYRITVIAGVLVVVLTVGTLVAARRRWGNLPLVATVQAGTLLVLLLQVHSYPENDSAGFWNFPASVPAMEQRFDSRYTGTMIQFASLPRIRIKANHIGSQAWGDILGGSMFHAVGVRSVNTYSGVGMLAFTNALCMDFKGSTRPCGYRNLFKPTEVGKQSLASLMKVDTIVLQKRLLQRIVVKPGWRIADTSKQVVVMHPTEALPYPGSRLSWVSDGVSVSSADTLNATHEIVDLRSDSSQSQTLVFARLGWPGYSAQLDGRDLAVSRSDAGLLEVHLPPGNLAGRVEVTFRPPDQVFGLGLAGVAVVVALLCGLVPPLLRRRRQRTEQVDGRSGEPMADDEGMRLRRTTAGGDGPDAGFG